jgi:hypothetical protein
VTRGEKMVTTRTRLIYILLAGVLLGGVFHYWPEEALGTTLLAGIVLAWLSPAIACIVVGRWILRRLKPAWRELRRVVVAMAFGLGLMAVLHVGLLDGWPWSLMPLFGLDDTEWAPNYSTIGFLSVRRGMTEQEVLGAVGAPLERYEIKDGSGRRGWRWSRSGPSGSYSIRVVVFESGRVVEKFSEYYLD